MALSLSNIYSNNLNKTLERQNNQNNKKAQQSRESQKEALVSKNYNDIYRHEAAHKAAAGSFGGAIVIEKNSEGIPVGGHVDIKMPALNTKDPDKTISDARTVIGAAMAPSDPSSQDYKVAAQARSIMSQAEYMKKQPQVGKKLNVQA